MAAARAETMDTDDLGFPRSEMLLNSAWMMLSCRRSYSSSVDSSTGDSKCCISFGNCMMVVLPLDRALHQRYLLVRCVGAPSQQMGGSVFAHRPPVVFGEGYSRLFSGSSSLDFTATHSLRASIFTLPFSLSS